MIPVTVMIFTLDEEVHLRSCLDSVKWCDDVIVVDSFSSDNTEKICREKGVRFFQHKFEGFGTQRNWALENTQPKYDWVLILDADEWVTKELADEIGGIMKLMPKDAGAFRLKRRFYMWGRWLRHSGLYPSWVVRLVHKDRVSYSDRGHAETQMVDGKIFSLKNDLMDENLKGIDEWFDRQNRYSSKEAAYELEEFSKNPVRFVDFFSSDPLIRRQTFKKISWELPARDWCYFVYSYFFRLGFLDGKEGLVFSMMKSVYYRMIVAKKHDLLNRGKK